MAETRACVEGTKAAHVKDAPRIFLQAAARDAGLPCGDKAGQERQALTECHAWCALFSGGG